MDRTPDGRNEPGDADEAEPLRDTDPTTTDDPTADAAQADWERDAAQAGTAIGDEGVAPAPRTEADDVDDGAGAAEGGPLPESQGENPLLAELGEDGEGDLSPEDV